MTDETPTPAGPPRVTEGEALLPVTVTSVRPGRWVTYDVAGTPRISTDEADAADVRLPTGEVVAVRADSLRAALAGGPATPDEWTGDCREESPLTGVPCGLFHRSDGRDLQHVASDGSFWHYLNGEQEAFMLGAAAGPATDAAPAIVAALVEHQWQTHTGRCRCGWRWTPATAQDERGWERHQAEAVAAALAATGGADRLAAVGSGERPRTDVLLAETARRLRTAHNAAPGICPSPCDVEALLARVDAALAAGPSPVSDTPPEPAEPFDAHAAYMAALRRNGASAAVIAAAEAAAPVERAGDE